MYLCVDGPKLFQLPEVIYEVLGIDWYSLKWTLEQLKLTINVKDHVKLNLFIWMYHLSIFKSLIYWYHKTSRTGLVTMTIQQYVVICCLGWFWKVTMAFHSHCFYLTPIKHTTYQFSHSLSKCCFQMWSWWDSNQTDTKKKRNKHISPAFCF